MGKNIILIFLIGSAFCSGEKHLTRPHIIFILADDLGWNDVGFHGSNQIPTPNIDALAYSGVILNNYYVPPLCTPSRSALMTGKYPIHTGMQHAVLFNAEPRGLPLTEKLLPEYLEELGYVNHMVGKWHLGFYKKEYTPLYRGFKSHLGYWTGFQDYYDHTAIKDSAWGLTMRRNMDVAYDLHGQYSTDVFTQESVRLISGHNTSEPLFLYLSHLAVHSANPYNPLPASDEVVESFSYIEDYKRRRFAAIMSRLDDSVGQVTKALKDNNMLENSIIIFTTDNGGPAAGFNLNYASNYPLKGVKSTLWEGGVRGAALIWSPLIKDSYRVSGQMMHISDWLPTLVEAAGGDISELTGLDGISMWSALSQNKSSNRTEILHNIDDIYGDAALTVGSWKIVKGTNFNGTRDSWYGPSGREYNYNLTSIQTSPAGLALKSIQRAASSSQMEALREQVTINCTVPSDSLTECKPLIAPCLFNIVQDPCETNNLANEYPSILQNLEITLQQYNNTAIPAANLPSDPRADPKLWQYVWTNFGDYVNDTTTATSI